MKPLTPLRLFIYISIFGLITALPFLKFGNSFSTEEMSRYGTWVSGLTGLLTLYLIIIAYNATKEQMRLVEKQSFDSIFFNLIQSHRTIIERLQSGKQSVLEEDCKEQLRVIENFRNDANIKYSDFLDDLTLDIRLHLKTIDKKDFFDSYYFLLDKNYKINRERNTLAFKEVSVPKMISPFFKNTIYVVRHYFQSFFWIMNYVHDKKELTTSERHEYIAFFTNNLTSDELRIIFYYIIWLSVEDYHAAVFHKDTLEFYNVFDFKEDDVANFNLIFPEDDWKSYKAIPILA